MSELNLTPTSYVVLGLVSALEPCTPYDMKQLANVSIGCFWSFPHSQLYAEPARLAEAGYLAEEREEGGRRRRCYELTPQGRRALDAWLAIPADEIGELRDLGLLKLFFSGRSSPDTVRVLAAGQQKVHEERIEVLTQLRSRVADTADAHQLATLELGLRWDRVAADFWASVAEHPPGT